MTFLVLGAQQSVLTQQKAEYEFDLIVNTNYYNDLEDQISALEDIEDYNEDDLDALEQEKEWYSLQMDHDNYMIETIDAQLEGIEKTASNHIKTDCRIQIGG